jgi:hypothetical protein
MQGCDAAVLHTLGSILAHSPRRNSRASGGMSSVAIVVATLIRSRGALLLLSLLL